MIEQQVPRRRHRRVGLVFSLVSVAFGLVGIALVGLVAMSQDHAPQPAASAAGSVGRRFSPRRSSTRPGTTAPTSRPTHANTPVSPPMQLQIPSIGVSSPINTLGLQSDGSLEVPQPGPHYNEAAWCDCSPVPGQLGPSVIVGHVDSAAEGPSVFFRLGSLLPGATVTVVHVDHSSTMFRVTGVRRYAKDAFPTQVVYGNTPDAQLRLITCGGAFDHATGHYESNVVVFATEIPGSS